MNSVEREIKVVNKLGLHARAAAALVNLAAGFDARIQLRYRNKDADAKSIMAVMMLAAVQGAEIVLRADGPDAAEAARRIESLFADRFGEGE